MASPLANHFSRCLRYARGMDWALLLAVFGLVLLGLAAIYSVELSQDAAEFVHVKKQIVALVLGVGVFVFIIPSNYRLLQNYALILYLICLGLLIGVLLFGETVRGAMGWYVVGSVSFQPVEFMKIALLIGLSTYFARRGKQVFDLRGFLESGAITFVPVVFVLLQPDFGSASILVGIWAFYLLYAGIPWRYVVSLMIGAVGVFILGWNFLFADYQRSRILTFLDPGLDPLDQGYNVTQAIIAVGSGQWFGSGLGFGTQSQLKFLPESQTDFIFAVVAEELGFFGVALLLVAFVFVFYRLFRQAGKATDDFTCYLVLGISAVFFLQFFVNIGMNLGLFPVTGIGLPFVSYGGSSLVVMLTLFAIAQSVATRNRG
ncbi:MAG: Rod shape-determining protein RodA [Candidatus Uhrbacteria bacterium GW2011_GWA2_52_8d]|uniref:Rod shape-determining protein RodA n=1 Tax=Candidatus Uhrbacteria bacterium GW2011_GWA2_52_8d TaxID=1618979 RepID=A0A0G2AI56_9BACT|nr:MAG: Rod shape-determining protein RodA [Candidatus Uhrbacteria bacterium GW2011_GWA2_52_8d]